MIQNKYRRFRPVTTIEQQTCSGVGAFLPHTPLEKRPVSPPIPKRRLGCSVCGSTPVLDVPPPKRKPFGMSKGESQWAQLVRHPCVRVSEQEERFFEQGQREKDHWTFLRTAEAEAQCLKMAIRDDNKALSQINKRILELENEIKNLHRKSQIIENHQNNIPYEMSVSFKDLQLKELLRIIINELDMIAEQQKQTSRDIMSKIQTMERVKLKRNVIVREKEQHSKSLKNINVRIRAAQEAHKDLFRRVRNSVY
ncbi:uncharacterized protein LOC130557236 [Triplophysa rosa]|uniref:uncharacterized protein LOC130557236 n=1 Tax=Triplophysa rosa TaxID=992332 RepID=UPI002545E3A5|nr:uncharacterized protein LOC130557236 [Triplophysa rosa]